MLYFLPDLWNIENLVFLDLVTGCFAENHSLILVNSSWTVLNNVFYVTGVKKKNLYRLRTLLKKAHLKN